MLLPFGLLLACMAVLPLHWPIWWEKHYAKVALACAAVTLAYYLIILPATARATVQHTAEDYLGFITLIGSLYVVAGGIHLRAGGVATPLRNTLFLALGGVAANFLGTTGASMLLIRPWLAVNRSRIAAYHLVFFIFIVSNVGGGLTPMGDPPLLVGFLEGVPFWWVAQHCWLMWAVSMTFLLTFFFVIDHFHCAAHPAAETGHSWRFEGLWNLFFLGVIAASVIITLPFLVRAAVMVVVAFASYFSTRRQVHEANEFSFKPIIEVAILFFGIFATIMPGLDRLQTIGGSISPGRIYWSSGVLSAFVDSAPAYLTFFRAVTILGRIDLGMFVRHLAALSVATVIFGAVTYIGNGPNLMVKAIADHQKVPSPAFFSYLFKWAVPVIIPLLIILWMMFFR
jgi:Na+/H+ antiporter NhaD/arsenite permease-like protein